MADKDQVKMAAGAESLSPPMALTNLPTNKLEFDELFSTEEKCLAYMLKTRWPNGFVCPKCAHNAAHTIYSRQKWECAKCKYQCSIKAGTVMHSSKKPLRLWFQAIYLMMEDKGGFNALALMRALGVKSYQTAWAWFQKLREFLRNDDQPIVGKAEIDIIYIGGKSVGMGVRGVGSPKKVPVAVAVECKGRASGRVKFKLLSSTKSEALRSFVREVVGKGSTIKTDGESGFDGLASDGFMHDRIVAEDVETVAKHLPRIFRVTGLVRGVLGTTHGGGVAPWRLQRYLDEYAFRFARKTAPFRFSLFEDAFEGVVNRRCRTYKDIASDSKENKGGYSVKAKRARGRRPRAGATESWWKSLVPPTNWPTPEADLG
jgi:transposase-like protein